MRLYAADRRTAMLVHTLFVAAWLALTILLLLVIDRTPTALVLVPVCTGTWVGYLWISLFSEACIFLAKRNRPPSGRTHPQALERILMDTLWRCDAFGPNAEQSIIVVSVARTHTKGRPGIAAEIIQGPQIPLDADTTLALANTLAGRPSLWGLPSLTTAIIKRPARSAHERLAHTTRAAQRPA